MSFWIILISSLLILSFSLTWIIRSWALKHKIIDIPNIRSSHSKPTPRGGGLAIVITWYLGISVLYFNDLIPTQLFYALISGAILAFISLIDDIVSIKPLIRLTAQFITAGLALFFLDGLNEIQIYKWSVSSAWILVPFALLAITWFINLYNFLDGIDAYASIETISISLILFAFTSISVTLIISACTLGFLIWNWPRAKIFMGDVGSTQLGFILIVFGIYFNNEGKFNFLYWLIFTSPFWFDATLTLYRRWRNKEKLSQAHKKHAYQRLVQAGFSHLQVDLILIALNILLFLVILAIYYYNYLLIPLFAFILVLLYLFIRLIDKKVPFPPSV